MVETRRGDEEQRRDGQYDGDTVDISHMYISDVVVDEAVFIFISSSGISKSLDVEGVIT